MGKVDHMDGHRFEKYCATVLQKNGFVNVSVTPGSGDQGVDVIAEKERRALCRPV
ncbi:MAG: restriction endonuclease [Oscillospiraceae bacterium]